MTDTITISKDLLKQAENAIHCYRMKARDLELWDEARDLSKLSEELLDTLYGVD